MDLQRQINRFLAFKNGKSSGWQIHEVGPCIFRFTPTELTSSKKLGLLALVHGNETIGLPILNQLLDDLINNKTKIGFEIFVALGNLPAAAQNVRFVNEDLNRCFGESRANSPESRRARELESAMLNHCDLLVDLHQTQFASLQPFFIFQYAAPGCFSTLKKLGFGLPVVVQSAPIGENTGLSADEYVRKQGGFGTALELGEKGLDTYRDLGLKICRRAIEMMAFPETTEDFPIDLYRLGTSVLAATTFDELATGWKNFSRYKPGELFGVRDGKKFFATEEGFMLFPRLQNVVAGGSLFYTCQKMPGPDLAIEDFLQIEAP